MIKFIFVAIAMVSSLAFVACSDEEQAADVAGRSTSASSTSTRTQEGDGMQTPSPSGVSTRGPTQEAFDGSSPSQGALSFSEFWERRDELLGKQVLVEGKVLFTLECPPPNPDFPREAACVATAHLVAKERTEILPSDGRPAVVLQEGGAKVTCVTQQLVFLDCGGWVQEKEYLVSGVLEHLVIDGRPTNDFAFEASSKQKL